MKVLLVIRWPVGGIKTYIQYVYRHLCLAEHEYIIVAPDLNLEGYLSDVLENINYQFIPVKDETSDLYKTVKRVVKTDSPDVLHSHGLTAGLLCSIVLLFSKIPHILTTHDVFFDSQFLGVKGKIKKSIIGYLLNKIDVINPCGFDAGENFTSFFPSIQRSKVKPIRNGIDIEKFQQDSVRNLRAEAEISDNTILLGFFGRFMAQKGFDLLVQAIEEVNKETHQFHVACFGWGGFIREEQEAIKNKGLSKYFTFFPQTNDMPAALRGVDVAVMPSRWEACPLLPMEALVVGTPIISSDCIGMKEVCDAAPSLMFSAGSSLELIAQLLYTVDQLDGLRKRSQVFKKTALSRFDSINTAMSLNGLYESLANE